MIGGEGMICLQRVLPDILEAVSSIIEIIGQITVDRRIELIEYPGKVSGDLRNSIYRDFVVLEWVAHKSALYCRQPCQWVNLTNLSSGHLSQRQRIINLSLEYRSAQRVHLGHSIDYNLRPKQAAKVALPHFRLRHAAGEPTRTAGIGLESFESEVEKGLVTAIVNFGYINRAAAGESPVVSPILGPDEIGGI